MADPAPLWRGDQPPTDYDLQRYLVHTMGVDEEIAARIAETYNPDNPDEPWTRETLAAWVSASVQAYGGGRPGSASRGAAQATGVLDEGVASAQVAAREGQDAQRAASQQALADQRSGVIRQQVESYYDRSTVVWDQGPAYDGAALAQSMAVGVMTDAAGRPRLDPETGQPMPIDALTVWNEIAGLRFNMGRLALPGPKRGDPGYTPSRGFTGTEPGTPAGSKPGRSQNYVYSSPNNPNARQGGRSRQGRVGDRPSRSIVTPSQVLALLGSMDEDYLTSLQNDMWQAGLFTEIGGEGTLPAWGRADAATRQAVMKLFEHASQDPSKPIDRVLADLTETHLNRLERAPGSPGEAAARDPMLVEVPDFAPEVTSDETLGGMIDDIAQDLMGKFASPEQKAALMAKLREREIGVQRTEYDRSVADIRQQASAQYALGGGTGGAGGGGQGGGGQAEIDAFMAAISGQESGGLDDPYGAVNPHSGAHGRFQIMPANWKPWATRAGLGPNAPRTPENQEIVARQIMLDYYEQFGNWRDVAVAWYSGPDDVSKKRHSTRDQKGYPSISRYADEVMGRMGRVRGTAGAGGPGGPGGPGIVEVGGEMLPAIERFDPAAEAEAALKAADPRGWEAHQFGERAVEFYSLLGGLTG